MAKMRPKAGTKKGIKTDAQAKKEARAKRIELASIPKRARTAKDQHGNRTGVRKISSRADDRASGSKTYGWLEDVPGRPDLVRVKNRRISDHAQGRREDRYTRDGLSDGRPDAGVRISNKPQYDENYDNIFGKRKRGIATGHKKFKKKY